MPGSASCTSAAPELGFGGPEADRRPGRNGRPTVVVLVSTAPPSEVFPRVLVLGVGNLHPLVVATRQTVKRLMFMTVTPLPSMATGDLAFRVRRTPTPVKRAEGRPGGLRPVARGSDVAAGRKVPDQPENRSQATQGRRSRRFSWPTCRLLSLSSHGRPSTEHDPWGTGLVTPTGFAHEVPHSWRQNVPWAEGCSGAYRHGSRCQRGVICSWWTGSG